MLHLLSDAGLAAYSNIPSLSHGLQDLEQALTLSRIPERVQRRTFARSLVPHVQKRSLPRSNNLQPFARLLASYPSSCCSCPRSNQLPCCCGWGLLCYYAAECDSVVVCNPLTRCWRKLPPTLRIQFFQPVGMVVERETKAYKVVVAGIWATYGACYPTAEVFDSVSNTWKITGNTPPNFPLHPPGILCNGVLYWRCHEPHGLTTYDMQEEIWSQIQAPLPRSFESYGLVECQGKIYMIGRLDEDNATKSICILELQRASLAWREMDRMPSALLEDFLKDAANDAYFRCIGHSDLVLLSTCGRDMPQLLYDVSKNCGGGCLGAP